MEKKIRNVSEQEIERYLGRLIFFSEKKKLSVLPAFCFTGKTLLSYAQNMQGENCESSYFQTFHQIFCVFITNDFPQMATHYQEIIEEISDIINSQLFIDCMRPDIKKSRSSVKVFFQEEFEKDEIPVMQKINSVYADKQKQQGKEIYHDDIWKKIQCAYQDHRLDEAHQLKQQYSSQNYEISQNQRKLFELIDREYEEMSYFYNKFQMEGQILDHQFDSINVYYKIFEEEKQVAIKIEGEVQIEIAKFLSILTEIELFSQSVPFCSQSKEIHQLQLSRNKKFGTLKMYIPIPFLNDRKSYFYSVGYDRIKEKGSVFLFSKSIKPGDEQFTKKYNYQFPQQLNIVHFQYDFFVLEYKPISKTKAYIKLASKVDLKLKFLPQVVLKHSVRKFAVDYFKKILKINKKFEHSQWAKRIQKNPEYYYFFQKKISEYFD